MVVVIVEDGEELEIGGVVVVVIVEDGDELEIGGVVVVVIVEDGDEERGDGERLSSAKSTFQLTNNGLLTVLEIKITLTDYDVKHINKMCMAL